MKPLNTFNRFSFICLFVTFCSAFLYGCSESEISAEGTVPMSNIKDDDRYTSAPIINGTWLLTGFVDGKSNTIKLVDRKQVECTNCYVITFKEDYKIEGYTIANHVMGQFQLLDDNEKMTIPSFGLMTYAGETEDGNHFIDAMKKVSAYSISSKGLALHYDKNKYLLFEPVDPSIVK